MLSLPCLLLLPQLFPSLIGCEPNPSRDEAECSGDRVPPQDAVSLLQLTRSSTVLGASRSKTWPRHYWSRRGGDDRTSNSVPYTGPSDFSSGPSWVWKNEHDEEVRHSPLIDSQKNVYVSTSTTVRKFSPAGKHLWSWHTAKGDGKISNSPALDKGSLFVTTAFPGKVQLYSIDMEKGTLNWKRGDGPMLLQHDDCGTVTVHRDTMLVPLMKNMTSGHNTILYAANASDGKYLWNYELDDTVWNFSPASPGDGSMLFATTCGGVYKLSWDGDLIWRKGAVNTGKTCSTGGGALGPNGVFYVEYNKGLDAKEGAHIEAFNADDGSLLWSKTLTAPLGGWQFPAVGRLGAEGQVAVLAAVGGITKAANLQEADEADKSWIYRQGAKRLHNAVVALDGSSGEELWRFEEGPWEHLHASGDMEKFGERLSQGQQDFRRDTSCSPDVQGMPLIAGDGTVYMSSGHTGDLRAIKDVNGDGVIGEDEVSLFSTHQCFLNSPSLAPGMLVAAPCWGPMYVFKSDE